MVEIFLLEKENQEDPLRPRGRCMSLLDLHMPPESVHFSGKKILLSLNLCSLVFLNGIEFEFIGLPSTETIFK